jgi:pimeloyl-ACP methyl ester carboxylesterase
MKTFLTSLAVSLRNHIRAGIGILFIALLSGCNNPDGIIWDEMQRAEINGVELAIYDRGTGEPVLFVHGGMRDEFSAVLTEPALADGFRLIHYHRRGWGNSGWTEEAVSFEQQAADARAVLEYLGVERVHVAGLSYGGGIILQIAKDFPEAVHSLALLEPYVPEIIAELESAHTLFDALSEATSQYESGDHADAIETFAMEVAGENYRESFDRHLPEGWFDRWQEDLDALFIADIQPFTFTAEDAARVSQPVLNMSGEHAAPYFKDLYEELSKWFPDAENVILPDASHAMPQMNPSGVAEHLADFFSRHPIND